VLVLAAIATIGYFVVYPRVTSALYTTEVKTGEIVIVSEAQVQAQVKITATGYVVALVYAKVAAKVPGRIAQIFVKEGETIKEGAKVARLEDVDFKSALASSRARGAAARAKAQIARANLQELKVQIDRERPLVEKGVTAKATLDDLQAHNASLVATVHAADAETSAADAETKSLEVQLGSYEIVSPISGTVVQKLVEVGEGVSPGFGTPGVIEVVDLTSLVVEVDVPENRLSQISEKGAAVIILDAYPNKSFSAEVKEIGRRVNRAKASVPVKVRFLELPPANLGVEPAGSGSGSEERILVLPEMAARVSFLEKPLDPALRDKPPRLVVPASAVVQRNGNDVVFIVDDGEVRMTKVLVGALVGDARDLETKIPSGTKVVLLPPGDLTDGQKVKEKKK
jgi:RND family efflux transporter MFP subunit